MKELISQFILAFRAYEKFPSQTNMEIVRKIVNQMEKALAEGEEG